MRNMDDTLKNVSRKSMLSFDGATCITLDEFREMVKEAGFPECSFAYGPHTDAAQPRVRHFTITLESYSDVAFDVAEVAGKSKGEVVALIREKLKDSKAALANLLFETALEMDPSLVDSWREAMG
jgi:hypothetical protein